MTERERHLIMDLVSKGTSEAEFLQAFPVDLRAESHYITHVLEDAYRSRSIEEVECAMLLGFQFKLFNSESIEVLNKLMVEDWHRQHENIAMVMQRLKDA